MKKLFLIAVLLCTAAVPSARAFFIPTLPFLEQLRSEVVNQQVIASNDVVANKQLLASLKKALTTIDKTKTNYAAGAKSLGTLANNLNRTSVSNAFSGAFSNTVNIYIGALTGAEADSQTLLNSTFPSGPHTAAQNNLTQMLDALEAADTNNIVAAAKALSLAAKKLTVAQKLVVKAQAAPAPAAGLTATISGAVHSSFNDFNTTITRSGSDIGVNSSTKPSASGFDNIIMDLVNVADGTQTVNLKGAYNQVRLGGRSFGGSAVVNGTATITYNSSTKVIFGTFSFTADEGGSSTATVTVSGSFSGTAL